LTAREIPKFRNFLMTSAFWDFASFILVETGRPFRARYCLHHYAASQKTVIIFKAVRTWNITLISCYWYILIDWRTCFIEFLFPCQISEIKKPFKHWCENLRFQMIKLSNHNFVCISHFPTSVTCPTPLFLDVITIIICCEEQIIKSLFWNFPQSPVTSSPSCRTILPSTLFPETLKLSSLLNVTDQVSHPHKTTSSMFT
jgi:hypothetical protein